MGMDDGETTKQYGDDVGDSRSCDDDGDTAEISSIDDIDEGIVYQGYLDDDDGDAESVNSQHDESSRDYLSEPIVEENDNPSNLVPPEFPDDDDDDDLSTSVGNV